MSKPFRFKQFTIEQEGCAMQVGTDGVLLGAWAETSNAKQILDVGTGTGLIALMLAQRSDAQIDAIDIHEGCVQCAAGNFAASPWADRLQAYQSSLQEFQPDKEYDLIVSNPPYFNNSQKAPDAGRNLARHTDSLSLEELVQHSARLLSPKGKLGLILPADQEDVLQTIIKQNGLNVARICRVRGLAHLPVKRLLIEASKLAVTKPEETELTIEIARHQYTSEYVELTRDFYLNM